MTLEMGQIGRNYIVEDLKLDRKIERRLEALGLTYGTTLQFINSKKNGSIIFKVRGTRLAVGKQIAESIFVKEAA